MKATTINKATILVPNKEHQNFTATDDFIPKGTTVDGEIKHIQGKRRGADFLYRLFITDKGTIIFENNITPIKMETEVVLGANALKAEVPLTKEIKMPNNAKFANAHIIGAVVGTLAGFTLAKKTKKTGKTVYGYAVLGAVAGYVAGRLIAGKPIITVTAPDMSTK